MMFYSVIPPPPPRYTLPVAYAAGTVNGMPVPILETINTVKHPEGGCDLQLPEGTYTLRDDLVLAIPPPHPTEAPVTNINPLATTPTPPTCGVKITPVILEDSAKQPRYFPARVNGTVKPPNVDTRRSKCGSQELPPVYGDGNPAMASTDKEKEKDKDKDKNFDLAAWGQKRKKPKSNISKSGSSFISRVLNHEQATKRLLERDPTGMYLFANINRAFHWLDVENEHKQDPLTKILFTKANVLCHDVNQFTKSPTHVDAVMGSNMSDILWFDPASQKYSRINKNGIINRSSVNDIKWVPGSENLFVAAMDDGELIVFDKEREDVPFVSEEIELDGAPSSFGLTAMAAGGAAQYGGPGSPDIRAHDTSQGTSDAPRSPVMVGFAPGTTAGEPPSLSTSPLNDLATLRSKFRILKSVSSPHQTKNPVAVYKLSHLSVTQLAFSPDNRHLAVVLEDCTLRIIDFLAEEQLDIFHAYYGGLNCVAWSPDGKYLVTGGQDDLVTIWSMREKRLVARCQGHTSFVRAVAFDPFRCECEKGEYRFGSVGDDCRLLLWDFSPAMVHRPKRRPVFTVNHPVEKRSATAQLPPILSKKVSDDPLYSIVFFEHGIMTSSLEGHIRTWDRCSHDAMSPQQQAQPQSPAPLSPTMQPPRKPSAAISAVMSDGGEVPFANHNWNASGIQTNMWNDASGWKSREDRLGSQSTGQASLQSNLSPSQSRA